MIDIFQTRSWINPASFRKILITNDLDILTTKPSNCKGQSIFRERERSIVSCDLLKKHNYQLGMKQPNNPKLICHTVIPQKIPKDPLKAMDLCVVLYFFTMSKNRTCRTLGTEQTSRYKNPYISLHAPNPSKSIYCFLTKPTTQPPRGHREAALGSAPNASCDPKTWGAGQVEQERPLWSSPVVKVSISYPPWKQTQG